MNVGSPASIWLVGAGNMGGAMLRRWIASGVDPASITVIDPVGLRIPDGVTLVREPPAESPDMLVLAVKPQQLDKLPRLRAGMLVSILAGVEEASLAQRFDAGSIVRAMPNLPVDIAKGVVALHTTSADPQVRATAEALMAPLGLVEWIGDEALFHTVTALSGSGPGFVYRFIEAMAEAGTALGLPADQAQRFAIATVEGAAALAESAGVPPAVLADRVASPGGTTRAGLDILDHDNSLKRLVHETLTAAARRSAEMAEAARK
ncbi:MAG: pyrroline-5-carboxylate reductase [Pseudomonadota bacterium]